MGYEELKKFIEDKLEIWPDTKHRFVVSPEIFRLREEFEKLDSLAKPIFDCLKGLSEIVALRKGKIPWLIQAARRYGINNFFYKYDNARRDTLPIIAKVDFISGKEGIYITEIDAINKHGLGYAVAARKIAEFQGIKVEKIEGLTSYFARKFEKKIIHIILNEHENFYWPEMRLLRREIKNKGVEVILLNEIILKKHFLEAKIFLDFPYRKRANSIIFGEIIERWAKKEIEILLPPKPIFSSKANLALIRNDERDPRVEGFLEEFISQDSLKKVRERIPETYLLPRGKKKWFQVQKIQKENKEKEFLLKPLTSFGSKGIEFVNQQSKEEILQRPPSIVQEYILPKQSEIRYYDKKGRVKKGKWMVRLTLFYGSRGIIDGVVTARKKWPVHGQPDAIQMAIAP